MPNMKHVRIAVYHAKPGVSIEETTRITRDISLPAYRKLPGFVAFDAIHVEGDLWISISTWDSQQQAEAGAKQMAAVVAENPAIANIMASFEHMWIGEVVFSSRDV
jgi:heme-degrading monooxygenase HmoA